MSCNSTENLLACVLSSNVSRRKEASRHLKKSYIRVLTMFLDVFREWNSFKRFKRVSRRRSDVSRGIAPASLGTHRMHHLDIANDLVKHKSKAKEKPTFAHESGLTRCEIIGA